MESWCHPGLAWTHLISISLDCIHPFPSLPPLLPAINSFAINCHQQCRASSNRRLPSLSKQSPVTSLCLRCASSFASWSRFSTWPACNNGTKTTDDKLDGRRSLRSPRRRNARLSRVRRRLPLVCVGQLGHHGHSLDGLRVLSSSECWIRLHRRRALGRHQCCGTSPRRQRTERSCHPDQARSGVCGLQPCNPRRCHAQLHQLHRSHTWLALRPRHRATGQPDRAQAIWRSRSRPHAGLLQDGLCCWLPRRLGLGSGGQIYRSPVHDIPCWGDWFLLDRAQWIRHADAVRTGRCGVRGSAVCRHSTEWHVQLLLGCL